jgi:hypothetical protein
MIFRIFGVQEIVACELAGKTFWLRNEFGRERTILEKKLEGGRAFDSHSP